MPLTLSVVTAERTILQRDDVQRLVVPTTDGQITVLPMHVALMSSIDLGELTAVCGNETVLMAVFGGFIQVAHDQVTILADSAERAETIDEERAEAARQRAERRLAGQAVDPGEVVNVLRARIALSRATVRLRVRRRRATGVPSMR